MQSQVLTKAVQAAADPPRAEMYLAQLQKTGAARVLKKISAESARILVSVLSGSQAQSELLLTNPDWLAPLLDTGFLQHPRQIQGLRREVESWLKPLLKSRDDATAFAKLREFKQREMLRMAARDLARLSHTLEITQEISDVADVCLETVFQLCRRQLTERFGTPFHLDADEHWQETKFCVLGLGKLGGQELNYSSDVDVLFLYSDEGNLFKTPPKKFEHAGKGLTSHQFFIRLAEMFIAEVSRLTEQGMLFRIDLRLRPEGNSGPLARSLGSCENYYAQWGQTWERMMLIKARHVAGDAQLAAEFLEMIQPFRYPRLLGERTLHDIAAMKKRIETDVVKSGEIDRNVKLGRGGIREIEFIVQALQLLHAGRAPFLQNAPTVPTLQKLVHHLLLSAAEADQLREAYFFLRDLEHRLQMEANQQTHTVPTERRTRERLAALMGFESLSDFEKTWRRHSDNVRQIYDKILETKEPPAPRTLPENFSEAETDWKKLLAENSFRDVDQAFRMIQAFVHGPGYVHVSPRTVELARDLLPKFFARCPNCSGASVTAADSLAANKSPAVTDRRYNYLSDPDRVLVRLDSFIAAYGTRVTLYELWTQNPSLFELLLLLFDRSEFLAEIAIRTPDLVDELESSGRLRRQKSAEEILKDLRYGLGDDDQRLWIRRYHQAELMRIGLRDILGLADFEHNLIELSALADACLQYALDVVTRKFKFKSAPFCIVGLGKLGGQEINYGSDLDIIFVADSGAKNLPQLQRAAAELMELLSSPTEFGIAFVTDARLRPDGEKGLLVNTLDAYEEYYRQRAQLWEIQSLTRIRPVAGDLEIGKKFQELAVTLANFTPENVAAEFPHPAFRHPLPSDGRGKGEGLVAFTSDWKNKIAQMRERIEKERTPPGKNQLAIKTGSGGLMDAEFLAQIFCLENGWQESNTLHALQRARDENVFPEADAKILIENYRQLRRIEGILRRWSFAGETVLPDEDAPLYRVAVRCGFASAADFMQALKKLREEIRAVYQKVLSP